MRNWSFKAKVWLWPGEAAWHFVSLPQDVSNEIKTLFEGQTRGWGSLPVKVNVGETTWKTSIFPDRKSDAYILPLKASVRKAEGLAVDSEHSFDLVILV